mmetsp:Transcript_23286/g.42888  ORF Transcript_23286/g.42888 Transcript_23286/m.42888 type:complete len:86 (+) Transcript_23286:445-702(+)
MKCPQNDTTLAETQQPKEMRQISSPKRNKKYNGGKGNNASDKTRKSNRKRPDSESVSKPATGVKSRIFNNVDGKDRSNKNRPRCC